MTEAELDIIEATLNFVLPEAYRRVSMEFPFRPVGRDCVYWFANDPQTVIEESLAPLADGVIAWRPFYLAIGHSPAFDVFVMDTAADGLPVHILSHETLLFEAGWPTFEDFVTEWIRTPREIEERLLAEELAARDNRRLTHRRGCLEVVILLMCLVAAMFLGVWALNC